MMGVVTPETCRVTLQYITICILLQLVGFLLILNYDARNHELQITNTCCSSVHNSVLYNFVKNKAVQEPTTINIYVYITYTVRLSQWPPACWDCGFETLRGHGFVSVVSVEGCQLEVSVTS